MLVNKELLASVAVAFFCQRDNLVGNLAGNSGILRSLKPLGCEGLDILAAALALQGLLHEVGNSLTCAVGTELHTQTEFAEVLEQGVLPCGAVAGCIGAVRAGREGCAIDGGATCSVGNHHVVTEQLGDGLDVGSLTATCAGAGELEQRLCKLAVLHVGHLVHILLVTHLLVKVVEVGLLCGVVDVRNHAQGLFRLCKAHVNAVAAAGAVVNRNGDCILVILEVGLALCQLETGGNLCGLLFGEEERTDCCMRADECAVVALDTFLCIPCRNGHGHAALFKCGGACGHCTVGVRHEGAYREGVACLGVDDIGNVLYEGGSQTVLVGVLELGGEVCPFCRNLNLGVFATAVYCSVVHVNHVLTLLAIGLHDCVLHVFHCILVGDDAGDLEECALEDGVGTSAKAYFSSNLGCVDDIYLNVLAADDCLHIVGDVLDGLFLVPEGVQQQGAAVLDALENIVLLKIGRNVAGHEVRGVHKIRGLDGLLTEAEVGAGVAAGFLGIVVEVCLAVKVSVGTDDLDGVLVGTYGTIRTEAVELALSGAGLHDGDFALDRKALEGDIVNDADGEVCLGLLGVQVIVYGNDLGGGGVL